jgi:hypothetical protein
MNFKDGKDERGRLHTGNRNNFIFIFIFSIPWGSLLLRHFFSFRVYVMSVHVHVVCLIASKSCVCVFCFFFSNLGFLTAEASMFKLREKIASNEK